jgi:hypothetical protein
MASERSPCECWDPAPCAQYHSIEAIARSHSIEADRAITIGEHPGVAVHDGLPACCKVDVA